VASMVRPRVEQQTGVLADAMFDVIGSGYGSPENPARSAPSATGSIAVAGRAVAPFSATKPSTAAWIDVIKLSMGPRAPLASRRCRR
jgi:hypothetical protein